MEAGNDGLGSWRLPARLAQADLHLFHTLGIAVRGGDLASLPIFKRMDVTAAFRASCFACTTIEEIDHLITALQTGR